jgi:hypothetical protein
MVTAVATGNMRGGGSAWFHLGQSAYSWPWVLAHFDTNRDGAVQAAEWPGRRELFERLDRDHDGRLTPADFDWSDDAPLNRQWQIADQLLRRADTSGDGKLSADEWQTLFEKASRGQKALSREQLHELLFPPPSARKSGGGMPSPVTFVRCLLSGELGSPREGPAVGQMAPDFRLQATAFGSFT